MRKQEKSEHVFGTQTTTMNRCLHVFASSRSCLKWCECPAKHTTVYIQYKIWQPRPIFSYIFQSFPAHNGSSDFHPPWRTTKSWPSAISTAVGWKKAGLGVVQSPARFSANIPNCFQTASKLLPNCFQTASKLLPKCFQMPNFSKNSAISFHLIPFLFVCLVQGATAELDRADSRLMSLSWAGLMYVNA